MADKKKDERQWFEHEPGFTAVVDDTLEPGVVEVAVEMDQP